MQEMSAVGIPPSSLQGCIDSVFRNKHLILQRFMLNSRELDAAGLFAPEETVHLPSNNCRIRQQIPEGYGDAVDEVTGSRTPSG